MHTRCHVVWPTLSAGVTLSAMETQMPRETARPGHQPRPFQQASGACEANACKYWSALRFVYHAPLLDRIQPFALAVKDGWTQSLQAVG
jgi:hypothetical protein